MPATYANIDDDSTTPTASTMGFYCDLRNRTTIGRSPNVPVRVWVCASATEADDGGTVRIVDSTGATVVEVEIDQDANETWYYADGSMPATLAKYDLHAGGNTAGTLTVLAVCIGEYAA